MVERKGEKEGGRKEGRMRKTREESEGGRRGRRRKRGGGKEERRGERGREKEEGERGRGERGGRERKREKEEREKEEREKRRGRKRKGERGRRIKESIILGLVDISPKQTTCTLRNTLYTCLLVLNSFLNHPLDCCLPLDCSASTGELASAVIPSIGVSLLISPNTLVDIIYGGGWR